MQYRSGKYNLVMRRRMQIFANLSSRSDVYSRLLFVDSDALLHQDPFPHLDGRTEPLLYARDKCNSNLLNGGVVAVRPGAEAFRLMQWGITQLKNGHSYEGTDQGAMQSVLYRGGNIGLLPCTLFSPGSQLTRLVARDGQIFLAEKPVVTFHMNWVLTASTKRRCLAASGQWLVRPPPTLCAPIDVRARVQVKQTRDGHILECSSMVQPSFSQDTQSHDGRLL